VAVERWRDPDKTYIIIYGTRNLNQEPTMTPADEGIAAAKRDNYRANMIARRTARIFQCMECDKKLTLRQAERAVYGNGCPKCGGADIDEATP
jgi:DNA-directed RNA polymerase subunit RPC12/RpoP